VERSLRGTGLVNARDFEIASGPLASRLVTGLTKLGIALKHGERRTAMARGLSATQAQILVALSRRDGAACTPGELVDELGVGAPTVSEALRPLFERGLVGRTPAADDGRVRILRLTPRGRREAERVAGWPDFLLHALKALDAGERQTLLRAVVKMISALQEQGRIPVARMCPTCRYFRPNVHDDPERPHHCAFVDAPFGDRAIRLDCADHEPAA
jgi:DNA-binding MarR family transcriptional regulator